MKWKLHESSSAEKFLSFPFEGIFINYVGEIRASSIVTVKENEAEVATDSIHEQTSPSALIQNS